MEGGLRCFEVFSLSPSSPPSSFSFLLPFIIILTAQYYTHIYIYRKCSQEIIAPIPSPGMELLEVV